MRYLAAGTAPLRHVLYALGLAGAFALFVVVALAMATTTATIDLVRR